MGRAQKKPRRSGAGDRGRTRRLRDLQALADAAGGKALQTRPRQFCLFRPARRPMPATRADMPMKKSHELVIFLPPEGECQKEKELTKNDEAKAQCHSNKNVGLFRMTQSINDADEGWAIQLQQRRIGIRPCRQGTRQAQAYPGRTEKSRPSLRLPHMRKTLAAICGQTAVRFQAWPILHLSAPARGPRRVGNVNGIPS